MKNTFYVTVYIAVNCLTNEILNVSLNNKDFNTIRNNFGIIIIKKKLDLYSVIKEHLKTDIEVKSKIKYELRNLYRAPIILGYIKLK